MYLTVGNAIDPITGAARPVPPEYTEFMLCEFYHCLPSQLRQEDQATMNLHLKFLDLRAVAQDMKAGTTAPASSVQLASPPPMSNSVDTMTTMNVDQTTGQVNHASTQHH